MAALEQEREQDPLSAGPRTLRRACLLRPALYRSRKRILPAVSYEGNLFEGT